MGRGSNFARGIGEGFLEEVTDLALFKTLCDEPSTYAGQSVLPGQWEKQRLHVVRGWRWRWGWVRYRPSLRVKWVLVCALGDTQWFTMLRERKGHMPLRERCQPRRMSIREAKNIESSTHIQCKLQFIIVFLWGYLFLLLPGKMLSYSEQNRSVFRHRRRTNYTQSIGDSMLPRAQEHREHVHLWICISQLLLYNKPVQSVVT